MNRFLILSLIASATVGGVFSSVLVNPPVELQPASPGLAQTGHVNVTGKILAGSVSATDASTNAQAVSGNATSATGSTFGGIFRSSSPNGTGVRGVSSNATSGNGGTFQCAGTIGAGVRGFSTALTGENYGVYGQATSPDGFAGFFNGRLKATGRTILNGYTTIGPRLTPPLGSTGEVLGLSSSVADWTGMYITTPSGGKPYYAYNNTGHYAFTYLNPSGHLVFNAAGDRAVLTNTGMFGVGILSPQAPVDARNDAVGFGSLHAQNGTSQATSFISTRRALFAESKGNGLSGGVLAVGSSSNSVSIGVEAYAWGNGGTNYGVYAAATNGTTNYAGYFAGLLYASSSTAGVKSFLIDHPLDPANKFLEHSSVESDERMNIYRGVIVTDDRGYANVAVPGWFSALNEDIQYQLTVVDTADTDSFTQVKVVGKMRDNQFKIRTSAPNVEVNWQVSGSRHDPTSAHYPLQVERSKNKYERGKYLEPEAFGEGLEKSIAQGSRPLETRERNAAPAKSRNR